MIDQPEGSLRALASQSGASFPNLERAREFTAEKLEEERKRFAEFRDGTESVVLFGSWARGELTTASDNDWALITGPDGTTDQTDELLELCRRAFDRDEQAPGEQGVFGCQFGIDELTAQIGLDEDSNTNLTRRMLFVLESVSVAGDSHEQWRRAVLNEYLERGVKPYRPPRFLLNDLIRYWRTICVDFEGKAWKTSSAPKKWVLRNAKLRTSRKLLFMGGLIPILLCARLPVSEMEPFLLRQLRVSPADRLAAAFLWADGMVEPGARVLGAYDEWLGLMSDDRNREELSNLTAETRDYSELFAQIRGIGEKLDKGFQALLFETKLANTTRKYAVL